MSMQQVIIPDRFLNYLYHSFRNLEPEQQRVKVILSNGKKYTNLQVLNGCVLLIDKKVRIKSIDIEILQIDLESVLVLVQKK